MLDSVIEAGEIPVPIKDFALCAVPEKFSAISLSYTTLTPDNANEWLKWHLTKADKERHFKHRRANAFYVRAVARAMQEGQWPDEDNIIAFSTRGHVIAGANLLRAIKVADISLCVMLAHDVPRVHEADILATLKRIQASRPGARTAYISREAERYRGQAVEQIASRHISGQTQQSTASNPTGIDGGLHRPQHDHETARPMASRPAADRAWSGIKHWLGGIFQSH